MVHTRINERTANPNPHINFISALSPPSVAYGSGEDSEAKELLRALSAQLKPVMKRHGFTVNSLEEYESNKVFLGRNWNNGETVELVLRDNSGRFYPTSRLLGIFCHELAHIKHMNHSGAFHALRRELSLEVSELQRQGYFGDGYWSAGTRLSDSERVISDGLGSQELPEYTCGGAHLQSRNSALPSRRRRRPRKPVGPSLSTGAQTAKQRKAGSRIKSDTVFGSAGKGDVLDESTEKGGKGSAFRKQAGSKRAREERALAAERRLMVLQGNPTSQQNKSQRDVPKEDEESETDEDEDEDELASFERVTLETDTERLKRMRDMMGATGLGALRDEDEDIALISHSGVAFTDTQGTGKNKTKHHQQSVGSDEGSQPGSDTEPFLLPTSVSSTSTHSDLSKSKQKRFHASDADQTGGPIRGEQSFRIQDDLLGGELRSGVTREGPPFKKQKSSALPSPEIPDIARGAPSSSSAASSSRLGQAPDLPSTLSATHSSRGNMLREEMQQRKREALGMDKPKRLGSQIGTRSSKASEDWACDSCTLINSSTTKICAVCETARRDGCSAIGKPWSCLACTYENAPDMKQCAMCDQSKA